MMAFTGAPAAPRAAPAPAAAPVGGGMPMGGAAPMGGAVPSKEEVAAAKADADLFAWAHQTLAAQGSAKAAEMNAKAQQKSQAYQALKAVRDEAEKRMSFA